MCWVCSCSFFLSLFLILILFGSLRSPHTTDQNRITYLDISNRDLGGSLDLKDFTNLKSFNSYSNKFENLDFLNSLPNKDKLQKLNFYGNDLKEIDVAWLLSNFPNLQTLNLENNPISAKNLQKLTNEQINSFCEKIKEKKFKVNSYKGTILPDLLFYLQTLIKGGDKSHHGHAHYLESLISRQTPTNTTQPSTSSAGAVLLATGGIILAFLLVFLVGYHWGKKKNVDDE